MKNPRSPLSRKLLVTIFLVSSCVTLLITAIQLGFDYRQELGAVEATYDLIQKGSLSTITKSLWDMNDANLQISARGILNMPNVQYIEITDDRQTVLSMGAKPENRFVAKEFSLEFMNDDHIQKIGTLSVLMDLRQVYSRMFSKIYVIFLTQLLKTLIVSTAIYLIIYYMMTKPLLQTAKYLQSFDPRRSSPLQLQRKTFRGKDEFDDLADVINELRMKLQRSQDHVDDLNNSLIRKATEAQKANQTKSLFLANISHELRTPMHGILSFARFGQQKIDTASKEKIKSYFDEIYDSGSRLMTLLNDLLDLSKLESGKAEYNFREEDLLSLVKAVRMELSAFAEEKGLQVEVSADSESACGLMAGDKIQQVLRNLLTNAIKFSTKGTTIRLAVYQKPNSLKCIVINKGPGIPRTELESIFDKFVQSSKTKNGAGGTGLGLAICREIVQHHNGRIWADSQVNGETRFTFEIPIKTATIQTAA